MGRWHNSLVLLFLSIFYYNANAASVENSINAKYGFSQFDSYGNGYYKGRRKGWKRVWAEVEYNCTIDYNDEVSALKKKCFTDKIPSNGWYFFKEYGNATWIITDKIKIVRVVTEEERQLILNRAGYDEKEAWIPYKLALEKRMNNIAS